MNQHALSSFIWSVADLLRGDYKQSEYGKVILPFTVLRRLDCVLAPTKADVLKEQAKRAASGVDPHQFLLRKAGTTFYNTCPMDLKALLSDQGFYPETTDGCKRVENFKSCLATRRRILGLWNRSMYSNTSALAASSVEYFVRWIRSRLSMPKKPSQAALSPQ